MDRLIKNLGLKIVVRCTLAVLVVSAFSGCSKVSLSNPFGRSQSENSGPYADAIHYVCADKKHFYVRMLNNRQQAWLIYPDHEVNLNQASDDKNRYTSGAINLVLRSEGAALSDGEKIAYQGCLPQK